MARQVSHREHGGYLQKASQTRRDSYVPEVRGKNRRDHITILRVSPGFQGAPSPHPHTKKTTDPRPPHTPTRSIEVSNATPIVWLSSLIMTSMVSVYRICARTSETHRLVHGRILRETSESSQFVYYYRVDGRETKMRYTYVLLRRFMLPEPRVLTCAFLGHRSSPAKNRNSVT